VRFFLAVALGLIAAQAVPAANTAATPAMRGSLHWLLRFEALNQQARRGPIDLIYVGDSIVERFAHQGADVWQHYYAGRRALNLGIGGDRTEQVLWRLKHGNIHGLAPKLVIVMIGQNNAGYNTGPEIGAGITAIVQTLRVRLPGAKILLLAIFPRHEQPTPERAVLADASRIAAALADGQVVFYRDIDSVFLRPDGSIPASLMGDFEHPTAAGYRAWAEAIEPQVAGLMGDRPVAPLP
jgi:lysophospholipase L1-like esterase